MRIISGVGGKTLGTRFNHIAQPGDGVKNYFARIGEYDIWSIIYGYKLIPEANSADEEKAILNKWIKERAGDPAYRFGPQRRNTFDPTSQTEDLGDDAMKSGEYGIANLKRILPNLVRWSEEAGEGESYAQLDEMYESVYGQMGKYLRHVTTNIGGVIEETKTTDQEGLVYTPVDKNRQVRALQFLDQQIFQTPNWLMNKEILQKIEPVGMTERLRRFQGRVLNQLFDKDRLVRLDEAESLHGSDKVYTLLDLFDGSKASVFSELSSSKTIDPFRKSLQRSYIAKLHDLMKLEEDKYDHTSIKAIARGTLKMLKRDISSATSAQRDTASKYHLEDLIERIHLILDPK